MIVAPPTIDVAPDVPSRSDRATFVSKSEDWREWEKSAFPQVAQSASATNSNAQDAYSSALIATAAANFKGSYSSLSGALAVPASTYHSSRFWMLLSNVADVTTAVPAVSASWAQIPVAPNPNLIDNGDHRVAQRGNSVASVVNGVYGLDRFSITAAGTTAAFTVTQNADVPASTSLLYSLRYTVTTNDASIATGDVCAIRYVVEGFDARQLIGSPFTLSFWFRSSVTGVHCVGFKNSGTDRTYIAEITVAAANTWEFKTITVSAGLITAGTWDWTTGAGLTITWCLCSGATFQTTAGAWQSGNYLATSNQVNAVATNANIIGLAGVKLEVGSVATQLISKPYSEELARCRRYLPAFQATATGQPVCSGRATSSTAARGVYPFPVPARIAPTGVTASGATHFAATDSSDAAVASTAVGFVSASPHAAKISITTASGLTAGPSNIETNNSAASLLFTGAEF